MLLVKYALIIWNLNSAAKKKRFFFSFFSFFQGTCQGKRNGALSQHTAIQQVLQASEQNGQFRSLLHTLCTCQGTKVTDRTWVIHYS